MSANKINKEQFHNMYFSKIFAAMKLDEAETLLEILHETDDEQDRYDVLAYLF